jgi:hypothetical protein
MENLSETPPDPSDDRVPNPLSHEYVYPMVTEIILKREGLTPDTFGIFDSKEYDNLDSRPNPSIEP